MSFVFFTFFQFRIFYYFVATYVASLFLKEQKKKKKTKCEGFWCLCMKIII